ncbi:hypothetical protein ARMGADRAFT_1024150 [Armillaria gallica]|uniref:Uncharacterized protein n=1 Tax=Armillaria gallica TaxID=47427 RepID=A0A2H3DY27_ARMGA|nr:hypothetical protein ARMGADRAFT_1024150 [Armillaria gallica]
MNFATVYPWSTISLNTMLNIVDFKLKIVQDTPSWASQLVHIQVIKINSGDISHIRLPQDDAFSSYNQHELKIIESEESGICSTILELNLIPGTQHGSDSMHGILASKVLKGSIQDLLATEGLSLSFLRCMQIILKLATIINYLDKSVLKFLAHKTDPHEFSAASMLKTG